jgi:hypothetical protein
MARRALEEEKVVLSPGNCLGDDEILGIETPLGLASGVLVPNGDETISPALRENRVLSSTPFA